MKDFYGNEYVQSGWWWPFSYWANRTQARATAIGQWLQQTYFKLRQLYPDDSEFKFNTRKVGPGDIIWTSMRIRIKSVGGLHVAGLDGGNYDALTKSGKDPAAWVAAELAGQKWLTDHGRKPPDYASEWED